MDISDNQIFRLLKYCKKNNSELWITSSMSQKARQDVNLPWDIQLENFSLLLKFFNLNIKTTHFYLLCNLIHAFNVKL